MYGRVPNPAPYIQGNVGILYRSVPDSKCDVALEKVQ